VLWSESGPLFIGFAPAPAIASTYLFRSPFFASGCDSHQGVRHGCRA